MYKHMYIDYHKNYTEEDDENYNASNREIVVL